MHSYRLASRCFFRDISLSLLLRNPNPRPLVASVMPLPENCHLIIEAKRLGAGVEGALPQGVGYVQALGVPRDVVVTDGIRYRLYDCEKDFAPAAYADLANLKAPALNLFAKLKRPF
jgi:hypothetical protein